MDSRNPKDLTNIETEMKPTYKIAGFFKQLLILSKKNLILSKRNRKGTIFEIIASVVLVLFLLALRLAVKNQYKAVQNGPLNDVYDNFRKNFYLFQNYSNEGSVVYYYPNNSLIENIVKRSIGHITKQMDSFSPIGI